MEGLNTQIILQLGMVGLLFFLAIREFFSYLKTKNSKNNNTINKQLLDAITEQNENHLKSISENINTGNDRIVDAITKMHTEVASKLGEIKGKLDK